MFIIDHQSRKAVYEQLIEQTERFVLTGAMPADSPMPSVRSLSLELSVNPNTVQKAYTELLRRGIIYAVPGKGSFVSGEAKEIVSGDKKGLLDKIEKYAAECALADIEKSSIYEAVDRGYKGGAKK